PTEELLTRYVLHRDGDAFTALVERFRGLVLRRCRAQLGCDDLAQDAAQETFKALVANAHRLLAPDVLLRWLNTFARNQARTIRRRERRMRALATVAMRPTAVGADVTGQQRAADELSIQVRKALDHLPA